MLLLEMISKLSYKYTGAQFLLNVNRVVQIQKKHLHRFIFHLSFTITSFCFSSIN
uniref:Uncharacterized protein n=1 Tax=Arundo donax TaxID=35708 RepID=A0A0A9AFU8_ARUDO